MQYEKFRESNSLAAISRAIKEQQKAAPPVIEDKQPATTQHADIVVAKVKKAKKEKKEKKEKKRKHKEQEETVHEEAAPMAIDDDDEPSTAEDDTRLQFLEWYVGQMADCFSSELAAIQEADAAVPNGVIIRSLASGSALYSDVKEQRLACLP